jgi:hypothetical protein
MFSIDQNSHSLWDALPKLEALAAAGRRVTHFVEDVDVAFTALGSGRKSGELRIAPERFHHSGGSDWGAALFYHDFLGRQPLELRSLEPQLGMKIAQFARRLGTSLEDLYAEYSTSDNWMLIGPSYVGDANHHRLLGDLRVAEVAPFLREILRHAEENCVRAFPDADAQRRLLAWFAEERARVQRLIDDMPSGTLDGLYEAWLRGRLTGTVRIARTTELFALGGDPCQTRLLELFTRDYDRAAGLYNRAVAEADVSLHPLHAGRGELPFHAVLRFQERLVRTETRLEAGRLLAGEREFALGPGGTLPLDALGAGGMIALVGKAMLLTLQARIGPNGAPLAVPYHGSSYLPASHRLAALLEERGLLPGFLAPIVRVRLRFLDRLRELETSIRLPEYLAAELGAAEIPARRLGESYWDLIAAADARLAELADDEGRRRWLDAAFPAQTRAIEELHARKRRIADRDPHNPEAHRIWEQIKALETERLCGLLRRVVADAQMRQLDFWDSRGAILPWAVALGGEGFYREVLQRAEITEERHDGR